MVTPDGQTLVIAVLGLGEAGSVIARDLTAAGTLVRGYDPAVPAAEPVLDTASEAEAAQEAQLVLSVNSAKAAVEAFKAGLPGLLAEGQPRPDVLWADLNTASPGTKRQLAVLAADAGVPFADVAMMAPVPGRGLRVPMLASGPGAARYAALLGPLGAGIEVLDGPAGLAGRLQLPAQRVLQGHGGLDRRGSGGRPGRGQRSRGCGSTSRPSSPRPTLPSWTGSPTARAGTRCAAPLRWRRLRRCSTELGVPPLMAGASHALHERLADENLGRRALEPAALYASGVSAPASGCSESGLAWCGRFTMIRSTPASR